ncbi:hypothetical protein MSMTP_2536 [Methanosarcina sp. MTP4]|uniref:hypothetical protein n=1 Tax=Methanosarcina sp. MTP4 TaxID=1434100 RepID=UPI000615557C|nr:hypothetical protein [Methanosarcina sp. MTP4]AKB26005.1 hypothetical protein MSMTP_2536 [Methanosarcina sp. MTP4]
MRVFSSINDFSLVSWKVPGKISGIIPGKLSGKPFSGLFRDESGVLEPQADLLSTALAVIGFVVFAALLSQGYLGYEDRSFALEHYESASLLAESLAGSPVLRAGNPGLLSAEVLDGLLGSEGNVERERLFAAFSENYVFLIEVRTLDGKCKWEIIPDDIDPVFFLEEMDRIAASVPVVIELNPAESVPGTLTVVLYQPGWV